MDTTPFHLILFALDVVVLGGLFLWIRSRRNVRAEPSFVNRFEKSLYAPVAVRPPSLVWDMTGVVLFGSFGLVCLAVLSWLMTTNFVQERVYHFNVGQSIVEGIAVHGTLFLIVVAALLFWNRRRFLAVFFGCCALFLAAFSFNVLYWEPYHLRVEYYEIRTTKLTKRLRIVFVADIQTDRIGTHEMNTLKKIQEQKADLIILGGDYIQTFAGTREKHLPEKFRQMLLDFPLEAPLGVFAIAGNNTPGNDAELFRDTSVQYVRNTTVFGNLGEDTLAEEEGWDPPIDLILLSVSHSSNGFVGVTSRRFDERTLMESSNFIVMAGHFPNYAVDGYTNPETGYSRDGYRNMEKAPDLMLAGHTHGGQIVLPFYGPVPWTRDQYVLQVPRTMWSGLSTHPNGGHLLVTRGSGLERGWSPRIRLFCPAEISVIDIFPE
jgi:hypothetical protein